MSYQQILDDGSKIGKYSEKKSPERVAEAIARETFDRNLLRGKQKMFIRFVRNKTRDKAEKEYMYNVVITPLVPPETIVTPNGKSFLKHFEIDAKRYIPNKK